MTGPGDLPETPLLRVRISTEQDVFAVRRQARALAIALGLEGQDEIRVAAALSEVGRRLLGAFGVVSIAFSVVMTEGRPLLCFEARASAEASPELADALGVTRRLMDTWELRYEDRQTVLAMGRRLPDRARTLSDGDLRRIGAEVSRLTAGTPMEELAEHNQQLLATLAEVQAHRDELLRLNAELEETNRGVMALYTELSGELDATNRGVVALYAELNQRTEQARAANEAKTRFLANVSHELRSPVTSIVGLTRLLRDPSSDPLTAEQARQLELVNGSALSLLGLVNELLDLAKAESGKLVPTLQSTELQPLFDTLRGTLRVAVIRDSTELVVVDPAGVPVLHTDPILVTQILRNLLTNALKFTPEGEVRLTATVAGEWLELVVADTGIGIPEHEQERVFEEFHQVRNRIQASVSGTGLGLPYARRLAQILGGTITLASTPGVGTTVTVRLPLRTRTAAVAESDSGMVLVVDDDDAFRAAAVTVLRGAGLTVAEAADGRTALAAIAEHPPGLIVLDLRLPDVDGIGVLDTLAGDELLRRIPVVVLSAYPEDATDELGIRGVSVVLDKSATRLEQLPDLVRARLRPDLP